MTFFDNFFFHVFPPNAKECHDLCHVHEELDESLNVILPFKGVDLSFDSPVM